MSDPNDDGSGRPTNHLASETSLYLRQHRHNPVDWHPWGDEALALARSEDRPLLVSIGYSACHWCHVMERESFEDPETAALMNQHFVCIKVDREERPDVDQIYMDAVVRWNGHGGWPLNVFCTPDGRPFYGGTYFPPEARQGMPSFRTVVESLARAYREEREKVDESARNIVAALAAQPQGVAEAPPGAHLVEGAAGNLMSMADRSLGGIGGAPKFPSPPNLDLLLAADGVASEELARDALSHVVFTCRSMARGGMYDQLGGGFHRYSVDAEWLVPHFEKMLYDEGQLLRTYAEAWRLTGCDDDSLVWPIEETVAYLAREMTGEEGAFYASQDADSEGVEGKFYVWTPDEVREVLAADESEAFCRAFDITARGNFEGRSIPRDLEGGARDEFLRARRALLRHREGRVAPATDRKRVLAWNGLAISGLARAGSVLDDGEMVARGARAADFVANEMVDRQGRLLRIHDDERSRIPAFLDDHAAILEAFLDLYRAGAGDRFLAAAARVSAEICERFFDPLEGDLFLTPSDGEALAHRPRSDHDGATPNSTGLALLGLFRCATLTGERAPLDVVEKVLRTHAFGLERVPHAYPTLVRAALLSERGSSVVVIVGEPDDPGTRALALRARRSLRPEDGLVVHGPHAEPPAELEPSWLAERAMVGADPTAYHCRGTTCSLPITEPALLEAELLRSGSISG